MKQDVMIPKMTRNGKNKHSVSVPWLNVVLVGFAVLLIVMATFLNLEIKHYIIPSNLFSGNKLSIDDFIYSYKFIPQIPVVLFICSVLGKRLSLTSVCFYILAGLFFVPIFAIGGGLNYFFEYGFGYILGYIPAVIFSGSILKKDYSFWSMIKACFVGVLTIHILGIFYMLIVALFKQSGFDFILGWLSMQSGLKIIYDLVISFVLILIGKYLHNGLKLLIG